MNFIPGRFGSGNNQHPIKYQQQTRKKNKENGRFVGI
jgi:hypothetical protein